MTDIREFLNVSKAELTSHLICERCAQESGTAYMQWVDHTPHHYHHDEWLCPSCQHIIDNKYRGG